MKRIYQFTYYISPFERGQITVFAASAREASGIARLIMGINLCGNTRVNA